MKQSIISHLIKKTFIKILETNSSIFQYMKGFEQLFTDSKYTLEAFENGRYSVNKLINSDYFNSGRNRLLRVGKEKVTDIKEFDRLFFINKANMRAYSVNKDNKEEKTYIRHRFLINLFTHRNYYTSYQQTSTIFTGKFIEFIFSSFDLQTDTTETEEPIFLKEMLSEVIYSKPFMSSTKKNMVIDFIHADFDDEDEDEDEDEKSIDIDNKFINDICEELREEIYEWKKQVKIEVIPAWFLHHSLNRFFENLNILKRNLARKTSAETFRSFMQKVVYILLNSTSALELSRKNISDNNIAMADSVEDIKYSSAYRNISPFAIDFKDSKPEEQVDGKDRNQYLTYYIFNHPIVKLILDLDEKYFSFEIQKYQTTTLRKEKMTPAEMEQFIEDIVNKTTLKQLSEYLNKNNDKLITIREFKKALKIINPKPDSGLKLFAQFILKSSEKEDDNKIYNKTLNSITAGATKKSLEIWAKEYMLKGES